MKITVFNGSPKGKDGNTNVLVEAFLKGAESAGAQTENIFLAEKNIKHCTGCYSCWFKTPGKCVIDDDMAELLPKLLESDIVVFATPLYVDNVSGMMKQFMDRLMPGGDPHIVKDENGECKHPSNPDVPKLMVISNCGYPERSQFQVLELLFKRIARNFGSEVIGEIYRSQGAILTEHPAMLKPFIGLYKKVVEKAGVEIVNDGCISEGTKSKLEKPFVPTDMYIAEANKAFDKMLKK